MLPRTCYSPKHLPNENNLSEKEPELTFHSYIQMKQITDYMSLFQKGNDLMADPYSLLERRGKRF